MTGRGDGRLIRPSSSPSVIIGLTLSTSSPFLSPSSTLPFYITVTARILSSPHSKKPITLQAHPSPLQGLCNRSFNNIICTTELNKRIEIFPRDWPQYRWDSEDLRSAWSFVTIPSSDQGSYSVRHEVPRDKIAATHLQKGERYRVTLTNKCLGTRWWTYAGLEQLEGVRLRAWREQAEEEEAKADEEAEAAKADPELKEEMEKERQGKYGDGPVTMGEDPTKLAMVVEGGEAEFQVL